MDTNWGRDIWPQKNAENTQKNCFGEKPGFNLENSDLFFAPLAFFCG
jgi:hypothetical protein